MLTNQALAERSKSYHPLHDTQSGTLPHSSQIPFITSHSCCLPIIHQTIIIYVLYILLWPINMQLVY
jgi:hypothetical protein